MSQGNKRIILYVAGLLVLLIVCGIFYFLGDKSAVQSMTIKRITPDQAASAMQGDHFYSDYRLNTLIIKGQVASIAQVDGARRVTFKTSSSYHAYCDLAADTQTPKVGSIITVLSEGGPAVREPNGVLLVACTTL